MDGPNQGQTYSSPQSGQTPPRVKTTVHIMDGPNQGQTYSSPQSGRAAPRVKTTVHIMDGPNQGHKVDGPHQGSRHKSKKWTDPTRVINLYKSTKWTDPTRVELIRVHKVDGRAQPGSRAFTNPQRGQTTPRLKTTINMMDGPNQSQNYKSTKWMAINGHNHIPRNERIQPGS